MADEQFDLNAPELGAYVPEGLDTDAIPEQIRPAPVDDGIHWVTTWLGTPKVGPPVYKKGTKGPNGQVLDGRVVAMLQVRILDKESGALGAYLKPWYATTAVMKGSKNRGSQLTAICKIAGSKVKDGLDLDKIVEHVNTLYLDAGPKGISVPARTRWLMSIPRVDENDLPVLDEEDNRIYDKVIGQKKILGLAQAKALDEVDAWVIEEDEDPSDFADRKQRYVEEALAKAHIFYDRADGRELTVQAEVAELIDPSLLED